MNISYEFDKGVLFIRINGFFTKDCIGLFKEEVIPILEYNEFRYIVFNFSNVKDVDYYGAKNLKKVSKLIRKWNGKIVICNIKNYLLDKIIYYKVDKKCKLLNNELNAFRSFNL
ncbi:MAG: STAS domain-containing protein [Bacilli bacterium]